MLLRAISSPDGQTGTEGASLGNLALAAMESEAPVLKYAQFYSMTGNADNITTPSTIAGGSSRVINDDYDGETTEQAETSVTLKIMGDKVLTDISLARRGYTIQQERVRQLESFSKGLGRYLTDQIINGTGADGQITGIATAIGTGAQLVKYVGNDGATVTIGNDNTAKGKQQTFLEYLDNIIGMVPGGAEVLFMNRQWIARLKSIAREYVSISTLEAFGVKADILMYNNVPIVNTGYAKNNSTQVIGIAETLGGSTDCSSIYAVRFGERENVTLATNKGLQVKDLGVVGVHYTTLLDMDVEQVIVNAKAAVRLAGLRLG